MTSRCWFFTIWDMDWNGFDYEDDVTYMIWQKEECPDSGKLHYQGWCKFKSPIRMTGFAKALSLESGDYHAEKVKSEQASEKYCSKSRTRVEGPWEIGKNKKQGFRSDLEAVHEKIKSGASMGEIVDSHFGTFVKYHAGIEKARFYLSKHRDRKTAPTCVWLVGAPGTGKTRGIWDWADEKGFRVYMKDLTKWWTGYDQEDVILIDDYRSNKELGLKDLLTICDRYECQREAKGGYVKLNSPWIFITSNMAMDEVLHGVDADMAAMQRRCHVVTKWPVILETKV